MNLTEYFAATKPAERRKLAEICGTGVLYLDQCKRGVRKVGPKLALRLIAAEPRLTLPELRPDIWGENVETPEQKRIRELEAEIRSMKSAVAA